jgi:hypothetical protein
MATDGVGVNVDGTADPDQRLNPPQVSRVRFRARNYRLGSRAVRITQSSSGTVLGAHRGSIRGRSMRSASVVGMNHRCLAVTGDSVVSASPMGERSDLPFATWAQSAHCQLSTNSVAPYRSRCQPVTRLRRRDRQRGHALGKSSKYSSLVRGAGMPPSRRRMRTMLTNAAASRAASPRHIRTTRATTSSIHQTA